MNVSSINSLAEARRVFSTAGADSLAGKDPAAAEEARKSDCSKAAQQFEAIILRQLLSPALEPMMNSGMGGSGGGGGGVYGYMLTDVMANCLTEGGGLGLASMLEKQLTPKTGASAAKAAALYSTGKMNHNE